MIKLLELLATPSGSALFVATLTALVMERVKPAIKKERQTQEKAIAWWVWALMALGISLVISTALALMEVVEWAKLAGVWIVSYSLQAALSSHLTAWAKERK
jgi:hypothetical protein